MLIKIPDTAVINLMKIEYPGKLNVLETASVDILSELLEACKYMRIMSMETCLSLLSGSSLSSKLIKPRSAILNGKGFFAYKGVIHLARKGIKFSSFIFTFSLFSPTDQPANRSPL